MIFTGNVSLVGVCECPFPTILPKMEKKKTEYAKKSVRTFNIILEFVSSAL